MGKGAYIKTVSQTQSTGDHPVTMTMAMELLNIKRARVPSSAFEVPTTYTKIDGTDALGALTGGGNGGGKDGKDGSVVSQMTDSAKQGAKQGAANEVRNQAREKTKGALRGVLGKP